MPVQEDLFICLGATGARRSARQGLRRLRRVRRVRRVRRMAKHAASAATSGAVPHDGRPRVRGTCQGNEGGFRRLLGVLTRPAGRTIDLGGPAANQAKDSAGPRPRARPASRVDPSHSRASRCGAPYILCRLSHSFSWPGSGRTWPHSAAELAGLSWITTRTRRSRIPVTREAAAVSSTARRVASSTGGLPGPSSDEQGCSRPAEGRAGRRLPPAAGCTPYSPSYDKEHAPNEEPPGVTRPPATYRSRARTGSPPEIPLQT